MFIGIGIVIFIIILLSFLLAYSKIELTFDNVKFSTNKINNRHMNKNCKIILKLYILKKIKVLELDIIKLYLKSKKIQIDFRKIEKRIKTNRDDIDLKALIAFRKLNINFEKIELNIILGLEDACSTALMVGAVSSILGIYLSKKISSSKKQMFSVTPLYQNLNILNVEFNGIFNIKMIHIIYIIFIILKKGKKIRNVRTSNRGAYAHSHE